jgi:hypothetical protein
MKTAAQAKAMRRYKERHPERVIESQRRYRAANLTKSNAATKRSREIRQARDPEGYAAVHREAASRWRNSKLERLAGRPRPDGCDICGGPPGGLYGVMHFDHDHSCCPGPSHQSCGKCFRGWICYRCNHVLGRTSGNPQLLHALADFVSRLTNDSSADR